MFADVVDTVTGFLGCSFISLASNFLNPRRSSFQNTSNPIEVGFPTRLKLSAPISMLMIWCVSGLPSNNHSSRIELNFPLSTKAAWVSKELSINEFPCLTDSGLFSILTQNII